MSPTHNHGNILDLVIVSNDEIMSDILIRSESTIPIKSDHYPVTFKLTQLSTNHNVGHKPIHILDYSKGDYDGMYDFLNTIDLTTYYNLDNVESAWQFIKSALLDAIKRFIPTFSLKHNSLLK